MKQETTMTFFSTPKTIRLAGLIWLGLSTFGQAHAYDLGPVKLHGFISQGYILSSDNNINASDTADNGSFDFNEMAINATYQLNDSIVLSGQLGSRKLGDEGNNDLYIDYLQADIELQDWLGTRLGRFKLPLGFYNQTRDIDLARPTVFLPQSIYPESYRPFVASVTGGLVYGNIHHDAVGDLDYEIYYGRGGEDDDSCLVQSLEVILKGRDMDMTSKDVYGGAVQYSPNIDGLRFNLSVTLGEATFDYIEQSSGYSLDASLDGSMEPISVLSAEYTINDFTFVSEYMTARQYSTLRIGPTTYFQDKLTKSEGFYISGAYHVTEKLETAVYWESFYPDKNDKDGKKQVARGGEDHSGWHRAWTLAIRYDITDWWLVKAEGRLINGTALTSPHYNPPGTLEENWESLTLKTTLYF